MSVKVRTNRSVLSDKSDKSEKLPKNKSSRNLRFSRYSRVSTSSLRQISDLEVRKSLAVVVRLALEAQHRELFYQRVYIVAKHAEMSVSEETEPQEPASAASSQSQLDYRSMFLEKMNRILQHCERETFTEDDITGLFLCMGEYTLMVVEGSEDMVGDFCRQLSKNITTYWSTNKVFLVEDKIGEVYFSDFYNLHSMPININEKFLASTSNDEYLMGKQHWQIKERLFILCETLGKELKENDDTQKQDALSSEYNKLLPEVQRIELVLNSSRFYRNVQDYSRVYGEIPLQSDEDAYIWSVPYGYTPLGVFQRSPFDVNLTFSDYGKEDTNKTETNLDEEREESQEQA